MNISLLQKQNINEFSSLVNDIITSTSYYTTEAVKSECERFSLSKLQSMLSDPKYLLISVVTENKLVGFRIAEFDENLLWLDWTGVMDYYLWEKFL